jgi:D-hexose-6-phosphate mutarotase
MSVAEIPQGLQVIDRHEAVVPGLIKLEDGQGSEARIDILGGARFSLALEGVQVLTRLNTARAGGKSAVSHICSPQFSRDTLGFGLPKHGTARDTAWELSHYVLNRDGSGVTLKCAVEGGTYPSGLVVGQAFGLEDGVFKLITCHKNTGKVSLPVHFAEHLYLWTGYCGWDEDLIINGVKVAGEVKRTEGRTGVITLNDTNLIELPRLDRRIEMGQVGLPNAVLWAGSYPDPDALTGAPLKYESHYVCIEPAEGPKGFFGIPESMIQPEDMRVTQISLRLV